MEGRGMGNFKSLESSVYVFSKFTSEALIFESLAICALCATYAAFWVLRKRRIGVIENAVPSGVVKGYLNELILDAEQLRAQLFGLLSAARSEAPATLTETQASAASATVSMDPELMKKVAQLEHKMSEQAKAMDGMLAEKARIEQELAAARAAGAGKGAPSGADPMVPKLQEKISQLEGRLAEYSVIEDDLANLKRLQQENAQLRSALAGQGGGASVPAAFTSAPAPAAAKAPAAPVEVPASAPAEALVAATPDASFENLVDQVEESLAPAAPAPAAAAPEAPSAPAPAAALAASTPDAGGATLSKSDEDLVAEFEKMLNG